MKFHQMVKSANLKQTMKRATITISDELEPALDAYLTRQDVAPALTALVHAALTEFLGKRGFTTQPKKLRITPSSSGSGRHDVSINHDKYLANE